MTTPGLRPDPAGSRIVVVHGPADFALDAVLRGRGLVPIHETEGAVVWAVPSAPVLEEPSVAPAGSGRLLLTVIEAAERLAVGRTTIYDLINRCDLQVVHVGRSARIPVTAVEDFAAALASRVG